MFDIMMHMYNNMFARDHVAASFLNIIFIPGKRIFYLGARDNKSYYIFILFFDFQT